MSLAKKLEARAPQLSVELLEQIESAEKTMASFTRRIQDASDAIKSVEGILKAHAVPFCMHERVSDWVWDEFTSNHHAQFIGWRPVVKGGCFRLVHFTGWARFNFGGPDADPEEEMSRWDSCEIEWHQREHYVGELVKPLIELKAVQRIRCAKYLPMLVEKIEHALEGEMNAPSF